MEACAAFFVQAAVRKLICGRQPLKIILRLPGRVQRGGEKKCFTQKSALLKKIGFDKFILDKSEKI